MLAKLSRGAVNRLTHLYKRSKADNTNKQTLQSVMIQKRLLLNLTMLVSPTQGMELLTYVYTACQEAAFSDHYPLLLSLLQHTCTPYLM